jgi:GT2 family glycosyltransferase
MAHTSKVSIIILTTDALAMTKEQLQDVARLRTEGISAECLVVDNGSVDGTEAGISDYRLKNMDYRFIESGANLGFAGGNNVGIKDVISRGFDYVILMNNDLILPRDLVVKLVNYMQKNPSVGLASPKMYFAPGYEFHKERYKKSELGKVLWYAGGLIDWKNIYSSHRGVDEIDHGQYDDSCETDFANGSCMIIRSEVIRKVGHLDESLFLYWEDADFSQRLKKSGYKVMYFPGTYLWHKVSVSTGGSGSPSNDYFLIRNRFYFAMRYAGLRARFAVLRDTFRLLLVGRTWQKKGALDALSGVKGTGVWKKR